MPVRRPIGDPEPLPPEVEALIAEALAITEGDRLAAIGLALHTMVEDDAVADARAAGAGAVQDRTMRAPSRRVVVTALLALALTAYQGGAGTPDARAPALNSQLSRLLKADPPAQVGAPGLEHRPKERADLAVPAHRRGVGREDHRILGVARRDEPVHRALTGLARERLVEGPRGDA
jgi:hypothetical protein